MGLDDIFKSKTKTKDLRNPQARTADEFLAELLGQQPELPERKVTPRTEDELLAQKLTREFAGTRPGGEAALRRIVDQPEDITQDPTIAVLLAELQEAGDLRASRTARSLDLRGVRGGTARDAMGRELEDVDRNILSTLAPFASQRRGQQITASEILSRLGDQSTLTRIGALGESGALEREIEELQRVSDYQRFLQQIMFPYQTQADIASRLSTSRPLDVIQSPSMFEQIAPVLGMAAGAAIGGPAGMAIPGLSKIFSGGKKDVVNYPEISNYRRT